MKHELTRFLLVGLFILTTGIFGERSQADTPEKKSASQGVYELRIYTTHPGRLNALHARFRDHTIKLFEKHGIKNIIYGTPVGQENTLTYVIQHSSRKGADGAWKSFVADPQWQKVFKESRKDGPIVSKVESHYLNLTDFSPSKSKSHKGDTRLFELRTYTTAKGRLENLHQRFRDGELKLFEEHGITNIFYSNPLEQENVMVYLVAHKDQKGAEKSWSSFGGDPKWKTLLADSLKTGTIVTKVENEFLVPTDYSPLR